MQQKYPLLVILGPTAVGKTQFSLEIAGLLNGEIISADSMQIYQGMDIGTGKVTVRERQQVKHHLIDIIDPAAEFSVAEFQERVDLIIPKIISQNKVPLLVGGTGLYIKAVLEGFLFPEMKKDEQLRDILQQEAIKYGNVYLHQKLREVDPELAQQLHPNDQRRIIRGIEVYQLTGNKLSVLKKLQQKVPARYQALKIGLTREREELYQRINQRVDLMIEQGLLSEVKKLLNAGYSISSTALQGLGYKEIIAYLNGEYDLNEAIRILKRDTRHYAKRQLTWFKQQNDIHWFNLSQLSMPCLLDKTIKLINKYKLIRS